MTERVTVLLSGGIDSAACVAFYSARKASTAALFVDYGQAARLAEARAAKAIARHYRIRLRKVRVDIGRHWGAGLIPARNAVLVSCGLMAIGSGPHIVALGIHAGTVYPDCAPPFITAMQNVADLYTDGLVQVAAPFLSMTKADIAHYCAKARVPIRKTYSCERRSRPCGHCLSCKDRGALDAA